MTARPITEGERERLAAKLRVTTEQMARRCSVDQVLWNMHSNACLEAADALLSTSSEVRRLREALIQARQELWDALHSHMSEAAFNEEVEYIDAALSVEGEDELARGQGRSAPISTDTKGATK